MSAPRPGAGRSASLAAAAAALLGVGWLALFLVATRDVIAATPDASEYGVIARSLVRGQGFTIDFVPIHVGLHDGVRHVPQMHGLLHPLLLAPFVALLGDAPNVLRWPAGLLGLATAAAVFAAARRRFGPAAALAGFALVLSSPQMAFWARTGTDDVGFAFFCVAALALLERGMAAERPALLLAAGAVAGLGMLEKLSGIFLVPVLAVAGLPALWARRPGRAARDALLAAGPPLLALGAYLLRNEIAYGSLGFRFGVLDWSWKTATPGLHWEAYSALYLQPASLGATLAALGPEAVARSVASQAARLLAAAAPWTPWPRALAAPPFLAAVGLAACAAVLALRRGPVRPAALLLLATAGAAALFCVPYHLEPRYFLFLTPLCALVLAGIAAAADLPRALRAAAGAALGLGVAWNTLGLADLLRRDYQPAVLRHCADVLGEVASVTGPDAVVQVLSPATWTWLTDRPSVLIPSGGAEPIAQVARHYDARWLLVEPALIRPRTDALLRELRRTGALGPLRAREVVSGARCALLRLDVDG